MRRLTFARGKSKALAAA
ncbi:hypothetical protein D030_0258A, partial [Vibrio parahaemolyticus AQ3810]